MTETVTVPAVLLRHLIVSAESFAITDDDVRDLAAARLLLIQQAPRAAMAMAFADLICGSSA